MTVSANLRICLYANEVLVAESDDATLWRSVLNAVSAPQGAAPRVLVDNDSRSVHAGDSVGKLAEQIGIGVEHLQAACDPTEKPPYLHLDLHSWAAFRRNFPASGPNAVSGAALVATLLSLWSRHSSAGGPTTADVQKVLEGIGADSSTVARSIRRCRWLQLKGDKIALNPVEVHYAEAIARAFCLKEPVQDISQHGVEQ